MRRTTAEVVTIEAVLFLHPIQIDRDVPDGTCVRWDCGHGPLTHDGRGGQSGCDMVVLVPALVDVRHGRGFVPPLDFTAALPVVEQPEAIEFLAVCQVDCLPELEHRSGFRVVPFEMEVEEV